MKTVMALHYEINNGDIHIVVASISQDTTV